MISDVLNSLTDIIATSDEINEYCQNKYGKELNIFLGADERDLPEISNAPFVLLDRSKAKYEERNKMRETEYEIFFFVCIVQENITKEGNRIIYNGISEVEKLAEKIRKTVTQINYPIEFIASDIPSLGENGTLRRYPAYYLFERAQVKIREER